MSDDAPDTSDTSDDPTLHALKVAFCYMPQLNDINEYDFPGRAERTRKDVETVREALLLADIDPDEVAGDMEPDGGAVSSL